MVSPEGHGNSWQKHWIVVFKGTDIGVFEHYWECSDVVHKVPGVLFNGFYSQAQAEHAFKDALEDGIVNVLPIPE